MREKSGCHKMVRAGAASVCGDKLGGFDDERIVNGEAPGERVVLEGAGVDLRHLRRGKERKRRAHAQIFDRDLENVVVRQHQSDDAGNRRKMFCDHVVDGEGDPLPAPAAIFDGDVVGGAVTFSGVVHERHAIDRHGNL